MAVDTGPFRKWLARQPGSAFTVKLEGPEFDEVVCADWNLTGAEFRYCLAFDERIHATNLRKIRRDGEDWILETDGATLRIGYLWSKDQRRVLDQWTEDRPDDLQIRPPPAEA
jgi:hypothetical protein